MGLILDSISPTWRFNVDKIGTKPSGIQAVK